MLPITRRVVAVLPKHLMNNICFCCADSVVGKHLSCPNTLAVCNALADVLREGRLAGDENFPPLKFLFYVKSSALFSSAFVIQAASPVPLES